MLDAAACGLAIVIRDHVQAIERVDGNGLTYYENDVDSMVNVLLKLEDATFRQQLGQFGAKKISENYSWYKIAKKREADYASFL